MRRWAHWFLLAVAPAVALAEDAPPRSLDPRLKIELFAEHPQIVTPTGLDVDHLGRVWVIENNTHFQPAGYRGHPTDRILVMRDANGDGRVDQTVVFLDGLRDTMSVALRPLWFPSEKKSKSQKVEESTSRDDKSRSDSSTLSVYVATRRDVTLYHDDNGDLKPDRHERIVTLETAGNYPHNALAGFAFDALGWLYFGFGENLGESYKIVGSDGATLSGGGEGGNVYRCRLDGSKLEQWATGFWNPHASCIDAFGRLFTVDNDPDSRPPCRLLHVIKGGDYGFRFRNGRKGLHPFTSWNGEIPGTLPMVSGTGEAPSGILAYESDGLPEDFIGNLLVTSWGDHRIDRFRLKPRGASFESLPEPVIRGGQDFRPVGIACAPDGSLYCTDWMLADYHVHQKGRVWRISATAKAEKPVVNTAALLNRPLGEQRRLLAESNRLDVRRMAAAMLRQSVAGREALLGMDTDPRAPKRAKFESLCSLSLVPRTTEELNLFAILGAGAWKTHAAKSFDEITTTYWQLLGADIPQLPLTGTSPTFELARISDGLSFVGLGFLGAVQEHLNHSPPLWTDPVFPLVGLSYVLVPVGAGDDDKSIVDSMAKVACHGDPFLFSMIVRGIENSFEVADLLKEAVGSQVPPNEPFKFEAADAESYEHELKKILVTRINANEKNAPCARLAFMLGYRRRFPQEQKIVRDILNDREDSLRRAAVQWIAEERLTELRPQVEAILNDSTISADLFLATLAALEMLDGVKPDQFDKTPAGKYVLPLVRDEKRPASIRALALRLIDPSEPALDAKLLGRLIASDDPALELEAVRTLQQSPVEQASSLLRTVAADESLDANLRAEAVVGLARPDANGRTSSETRDLLFKLLGEGKGLLGREALRALRGLAASDPKIKTALEHVAKTAERPNSSLHDELELALAQSGGSRPPLAGARAALAEPTRATDDPQAGRRGFYHPQGAGCFKCHTINGRGGKVGPDLSAIGRALSREKLIDSILEPSREIAPQFVTWALETTDGRVHTGMIVRENADQGTNTRTLIGDAEGKTTELRTLDIVSRTPQKTSIMPEKLFERMSLQECRDLLAYLESLK
ncbi:MAG: PVC-type heme-binding CxxCH protein [Planctomycetaceae bacterium]